MKTNNNEIYFDNASTTPLLPEVLEEVNRVSINEFGNSSSIHRRGVGSSKIVEKSRQQILDSLCATDHSVIFSSSGTESNNQVVNHFVQCGSALKPHIVTSKFEHKSILAPLENFRKRGLCDVSYVNVTKQGQLDLVNLKEEITSNTKLVSIMMVNNEVGTILPIQEVYRICSEKAIPVHIDACQGYLKVPFSLMETPIDFMTINSHKIHGPKGVAALLVKNKFMKELTPLIMGGGHEFGLRSGTLNVPGIGGFGKAVELNLTKKINEHLKDLRDYFISSLKKETIESVIAAEENTAPHIVSIRIKNHMARDIFFALNKLGYFVSTSSACNSAHTTPSYVLEAMGFSTIENLESFRVSFSYLNNKSEIDFFISVLKNIIRSS